MPPTKKSKYKPINFYELKDVKKNCNKPHNPEYKNHHIDLHFNALIIGATGSGKTQTLMNLIFMFKKTFHKIHIFTQKEEPLYTFLLNKLHPDLISVHYGIDEYLHHDEGNFFGNSLVIFDDMVKEGKKKQAEIESHFLRGRKISSVTNKGYGCSTIYLSQSFFETPKFIRQNCSLVFVIQLPSKTDIDRFIKEYSRGDEHKSTYANMYDYCCIGSDFGEFLLIDTKAKTKDKLYRRNYDEYLDLKDFTNANYL